MSTAYERHTSTMKKAFINSLQTGDIKLMKKVSVWKVGIYRLQIKTDSEGMISINLSNMREQYDAYHAKIKMTTSRNTKYIQRDIDTETQKWKAIELSELSDAKRKHEQEKLMKKFVKIKGKKTEYEATKITPITRNFAQVERSKTGKWISTRQYKNVSNVNFETKIAMRKKGMVL